MIRFVSSFVNSRWYWLAVILVGLGMEAVALFFQYGLGEPPCALCIQSRAFTMAGVIAAIVGLIGEKIAAVRYTAQIALIVSLGFLWKVSREAVLVERGLMESTCGMDPGFPAWLALDEWFPVVFEVWTMCSYTPDFIFGMTLGEGLLYGVTLLCLIAPAALVFQVLKSLGVIRD